MFLRTETRNLTLVITGHVLCLCALQQAAGLQLKFVFCFFLFCWFGSVLTKKIIIGRRRRKTNSPQKLSQRAGVLPVPQGPILARNWYGKIYQILSAGKLLLIVKKEQKTSLCFSPWAKFPPIPKSTDQSDPEHESAEPIWQLWVMHFCNVIGLWSMSCSSSTARLKFYRKGKKK